ncbi:MAG: glycosyltransferase family 2 protein [Bacteroidota bacterium]
MEPLEILTISIITINYNNATGLKQTITSVLAQTYPKIQYVVIDGGSDDGSKEVLDFYQDKISYITSEPDSGIYNAMNKGIRAAYGDYLLFINSGDLLLNKNVIEDVAAMKLDKDLVYGNIVLVENGESKDWIMHDQLSFETFYHSTIPHPGTFIKKNLFDEVGHYNETYKIVSDWEFFLIALCKHNCSHKYINVKICRFFLDGISADPKNYSLLLSERNEVLQKHFPLFIKDYENFDRLKEDFRKVRKYLMFKERIKRFFKGKP